MEKSTFESLPNELLLLIFRYLSSSDLCRTFLDIANVRIQQILTSMRHSFDVSFMHYDEIGQFLSNINDHSTKCFPTLIDTIVLRNTPASSMFVKHWVKMSKENHSWNTNFSSIERIFILEADYQCYSFASSILKPLILSSNTLQQIYFVFEQPTQLYRSTLEALVRQCISIRTMILDVEQGMF